MNLGTFNTSNFENCQKVYSVWFSCCWLLRCKAGLWCKFTMEEVWLVHWPCHVLELEALLIQTWGCCWKKVSDFVSWYCCWKWVCAMLCCFTFAQTAIWWTDFVVSFVLVFGFSPPKLIFSQIRFTTQFTVWPYKELYWHISANGLGQEQTVRGG